MKPRQLSLNLEYGISREQACILCHLSSECDGCCVKCKAENKNGSCYGQTCSQPSRVHEGSRWDTWMYLVSTSLSNLKRFIPAKYRKHMKKKV
jgi:hypothetical protein